MMVVVVVVMVMAVQVLPQASLLMMAIWRDRRLAFVF